MMGLPKEIADLIERFDRNERDWAQFHDALPRYIFVLATTILLLSTRLTGCAIPIAYHDAAACRNPTDLKADRERKPGSVYELAKMLNRDLKNVNQDLKMLSEVGLVTLEKTEADKKRVVPHVDYAKILLEIPV